VTESLILSGCYVAPSWSRPSIGRLGPRQLRINGGDEIIKIVGRVMPPAIDEECRNAVHAALQASHEVVRTPGFKRVLLQRFAQNLVE
jgi:hypothetical protein